MEQVTSQSEHEFYLKRLEQGFFRYCKGQSCQLTCSHTNVLIFLVIKTLTMLTNLVIKTFIALKCMLFSFNEKQYV